MMPMPMPMVNPVELAASQEIQDHFSTMTINIVEVSKPIHPNESLSFRHFILIKVNMHIDIETKLKLNHSSTYEVSVVALTKKNCISESAGRLSRSLSSVKHAQICYRLTST